MTLLELAEDCERANGADRELDYLIACAIGVAEMRGQFCFSLHRVAGSSHEMHVALCYTASLDAAMSLVPEGWDWEIGHTNGGMTIYANVGGAHEYVDHFEWRRFASSAPLALASAALRARHAMAMEGGNG